MISDFESDALKKFNVPDVCYENADCSPIILAGRKGYEGAKDGKITNALLTETTGVAVRGRTIFFGEFVSDSNSYQTGKESRNS